MSRIVLAGSTPGLATRIAAVQPGLEVLPPGRLPTEPTELFAQLQPGTPPEVVVLGPGASLEEALALASRLGAGWPDVSVVLAATPSPQMWLAVMRAGIRDVVPADADTDELREVLDRASQAALGRRQVQPPAVLFDPAPAPGRVITVASPKGGVGKTTVATNLAVGLAAVAPQSTVLVDLDVQFGDVASALGLHPEYSLPDVVRGPAAEDAMVLKTFLTPHPSGLLAICGADSPAAGESVTGEEVMRLLALLAREFRNVVVDTAPGLSEQTLAALDRATDVVMLTSMDVPGVRGLRREIDMLHQLGMVPPSRHVVLNFADPKRGLTLADVRTALGIGVDVVLPRSPAVTESTNEGVPLLQRDRGREPATKEMQRLLARFLPAPAAKPGQSWFRLRAAS